MSAITEETPVRQFYADAAEKTSDEPRRAAVRRALKNYEIARDRTKSTFTDWKQARSAASAVKHDAVNHLDRYLAEFERRFTERGGKVFWARDGRQAREYIVQLARERGVRSIVKSKAMTGEEIHLNQALEAEGFGVVESDLGEFIQQLKGEAPYHFVFPCMHLRRDEISELFNKKLGTERTDSPEELTMIARRFLRQAYVEADMGISGGNFIVADAGMISITENEGNARLTVGVPKVHVALIGIEKVVPRLADLALFLPMLATAGTGQHLTGYNSMYGGPRQEGEVDGPEEFHVVFLDNHRTRLLADPEQRDALHCIRCGACLNVCPIFKNIGGHTYGTTYQGPIGSVITPHFRGLQDWKHLSGASSLCGACTETCPVGIDIHHHLLHNRRNAAASAPAPGESLIWKLFRWVMRKPSLYRLGLRFTPWMMRMRGWVHRTVLDPAAGWTKSRELPEVEAATFRDLWKRHRSAPARGGVDARKEEKQSGPSSRPKGRAGSKRARK